jgi:succinate dehydrogenase / fumarate reductase cytochrome b subunit
MSWISKSLSSSIGSKVIMAISGLMLVGFLVGHLSGNLLIFAGPEAINAYAKMLRDLGPLLWVARIGLLVAVGAHIFAGINLHFKNNAAKPKKYQVQKSMRASLASRTMMRTGTVVLLFILYHLAHYTFRWLNPEFAALDPLDVYNMLIMGFKNPLVSGFYILSVGLLCFHLSHGISSFFQNLGLNNPKYNPLINGLAIGVSVLLAVGYISIPVSVLVGIVA